MISMRSKASDILAVLIGRLSEGTMTVYESGMGHSPDLCPMGNGKMLVYLSGLSLWSLHCGYTAPSFFSLSPDLDGGYYKCDSVRLSDRTVIRHKLWCASDAVCDVTVTDRLAVGEALFLRTLTGKTPLRLRLELPGYVRAAAVEDYHLFHTDADALFCDIPVGTPFEHKQVLLEEANLALYLCGDLHFEEGGRVIAFDGGCGHILIVDSRNRMAALKLADGLLARLRSGEDPSECLLFWFEQSSERSRCFEGEKRAILTEKLGDMVLALTSMQSACGAILSDTWHPYAKASDLPLLTAALLKLDRYDDAKRMICYWAEQIGNECEGISPYLGCEAQTVHFGNRLDGASLAAFLLASVLLVESAQAKADTEADMILYPKMRKAFTLTAKCAQDGMIPFSGTEDCFDSGILNRDCIFHGSTSATAMAIAAAMRYMAYCERSGHKMARETKRYLALIEEGIVNFDKHFGGDRIYYLNAPELDEKAHKPRFIVGICPKCAGTGAFDAVEGLELDSNGRYRCKRCLSAHRKDEEKRMTEQIGFQSLESLDATASVALWMPEPYSRKALDMAASVYRKAIDGEIAMPKRSAGTDAMLVLAAQRHSDPHEALFRRMLIDHAELDIDPAYTAHILPSRMIDSDGMNGATCASVAIAAMILALA